MSNNPSNKAALDPKVTADNGGDFDALLQPDHQVAFVADPTDLATTETAVIAIRDALITVGIMKAS